MDVVELKSLRCSNLATDGSSHYFLVFTSAYWDFARFIPLTAFGLKSLLQAALTADVVEAVLLKRFDSWLMTSSLLKARSCQIPIILLVTSVFVVVLGFLSRG